MHEVQLKSKWGEKQIKAHPTNEFWDIVSHRAGLVKALNLIGPESSDILLYFDGFSTVRVPSKDVSFHIATENSSELEECPIADIRYSQRKSDVGVGWREIKLWFKDRAQLERYVQVVVLPIGEAKLVPEQKSQAEGSSSS
ncbi:MAG: hypothetical protein COU07_01745 [Candidatus Harrisonbacteria bacterium CG10_big_fil_rev_8_21_14_0_10_40_38]|uniref:Uncharacterized protein n=1 Tax=Candidatus Harrisonbacteria bacterium CG10_big_fil_rev_8_21_14_0_10_40_38 TaxID=1974583 RepID=A0A2H0UT41_9BACT|nr:MAG: hypothetical protein COU07_01745 [Candidatus Harrisonbacteria bacterium CG10_big_fil_rev_8_21_14_0_10_40_38]